MQAVTNETMRLLATAIALLILVCHGDPLLAADDARPRYSLKQDAPDLGTLIKRDLVTGSVLPLNKTYAELSPEEQAYVKSQYDQIGPNDEPPFPIQGLLPIYKSIAAGQNKMRVRGPMTLVVDVNGLGEATSVSVLQSPDPDMVKFAASVLILQKYKPASCNGTPCAMQFPFRMNFGVSL